MSRSLVHLQSGSAKRQAFDKCLQNSTERSTTKAKIKTMQLNDFRKTRARSSKEQSNQEKMSTDAINNNESDIDHNGLVNEGATCYINSLLQSLFHTNKFRQLIYSIDIEPEDVNDSFVFWLKYIFYAMQFNVLPQISTVKFVNCFNWNAMTTTDQQDIEEFFRILMDKLDQFMDGKEMQYQLRDLFVGELKITTKCEKVNHNAEKIEIFWMIPLSIDDVSNISEAFEKYMSPSTIQE